MAQHRQHLENKYECSIDECTNIAKVRGYCNAHYLKLLRFGNPLFSKKRVVYRKRGKKVLTCTCLYCGQKIEKPTYKRKYCSTICAGMANRKPYILKKGYKKLLIPDHPRSDKKGYVFEHIVIVEAKICRMLKEKEVVHHVDGNKTNNNPNNLEIFPDNKTHIKHHHHLVGSGGHL